LLGEQHALFSRFRHQSTGTLDALFREGAKVFHKG
jgi:hypothetical protein